MAIIENPCLVDQIDFVGVELIGSKSPLPDGIHSGDTYSCQRPGCTRNCRLKTEVKDKKIRQVWLEEGGGECLRDIEGE